MLDHIKQTFQDIQGNDNISNLILRQANLLYVNGQCQMLTVGKNRFEIAIDDEFKDVAVSIFLKDDKLISDCSCKTNQQFCHHSLAGLMELSDYLKQIVESKPVTGKSYTRQGMLRRVLAERRDKADRAEYRIDFADNVFGEHELINERGVKYKLTFRDFTKELGYCTCPDFQTNKLGTCKHLMFAFRHFQQRFKKTAIRKRAFPFFEIYLDPLNDYQIAWFYPNQLPAKLLKYIVPTFGDSKILPSDKMGNILQFINQIGAKKNVLIRPEVNELIENYYEELMLEQIRKQSKIDFSIVKIDLFPYQKEGIEFAVFRKNAIIADEMGLGKTVQAIAIALMKRELFGMDCALIICPASLKQQWQREIERFTDEKALIIEGFPDVREQLYKKADTYFKIINYETVLRDIKLLQELQPDFIILDEAQRIKNYETLTANSIKQIPKRHALVITGTPIENRLIDLYSIVGFLDQKILTPLWEFSYQHCYFDMDKKNKITGYYGLQKLNERLQSLIIRRQKNDVFNQLPDVSQINIPVKLHPEQASHHAGYAQGVASILRKKFITPFEMQKLMLLMTKMRMVCDSTYLIDQETNISPKLDELKHVLLEKLDLQHNYKKIVVFSEWVRMNHIIGHLLQENDIGFVELNGKVPVPKRTLLIKEFENNRKCQVFLSTEAGGTGLNLQVADTVINFELPWNPAKKNQRIGRIDRLGQKSKHLMVINFITENSIEERIAKGLAVKQALFDGVLNAASGQDVVDLSEKGRSQFLNELETAMADFIVPPEIEDNEQELIIEEKDSIIDMIQEPDESSVEHEKQTENAILQTGKSALPTAKPQVSTDQLTSVMTQGLGFLSGIMKMATGQELAVESNAIEVDQESGEVTLKFKLPGFEK